MTTWSSWEDLRRELVRPEHEPEIAAIRQRMLAELRAYRLAEVRRERGLTQQEVAEARGVDQSRVSRIEHGEVDRSEVNTLSSYLAALGGKLRLVADFGDQTLTVA